MRINYAIVFVADMQKSIAFYRDVIGLKLRFDSPEWTEFATEGATLALHSASAAAEAQPPAERTPAGRCRPGLSVPDIDAFHARMKEKGVPCFQEPKEVFGARIAQYLDPDGMAFSVSEERRAPAR